MMRTPSLEYCLDSPHLWPDASALNLVAKDMEIADKYLAQVKEKKDAIDQLNTAYQAMYCASIQGIRVSLFGCRFTRLFCKEGIIGFQTCGSAHPRPDARRKSARSNCRGRRIRCGSERSTEQERCSASREITGCLLSLHSTPRSDCSF